MIYSSKVSTFAFIIELNTLTWTFRSRFFIKSRYLRTILFGLIKWPSLWLGICAVTTDGFQYIPLGFVAFVFLYPPIAIVFISGQYVIMFTWVVIIGLVNTIWGVPTILVVAFGSIELWFKFLPVEIPPNPLHKFVVVPINTPTSYNIHVGCNHCFHSCGCYDNIRWLNNLYFNKLALNFSNYRF
jgi:hypothetical protein